MAVEVGRVEWVAVQESDRVRTIAGRRQVRTVQVATPTRPEVREAVTLAVVLIQRC